MALASILPTCDLCLLYVSTAWNSLQKDSSMELLLSPFPKPWRALAAEQSTVVAKLLLEWVDASVRHLKPYWAWYGHHCWFLSTGCLNQPEVLICALCPIWPSQSSTAIVERNLDLGGGTVCRQECSWSTESTEWLCHSPWTL